MKRARRTTLNTYLLATVTLLLGALLSLNTHNWQWFSRCGSLLVIYGIILTSHQIIEHMQELKLLQRQVSGSQRDWAPSDKKHLVKESHEHQWRDEKYGLFMLVAGTFIWGFGDLVGLI